MSQNEKKTVAAKQPSAGKHVLSFAVMILLTAAAFYLIAVDVMPKMWIVPLLLFFATIQVILQLFTFMHLSEKGSLFYIIFMISGLFIAIISAIGLFLMNNTYS